MGLLNMNKDYKTYWKEFSNEKKATALHHFQYCVLKAFFSKAEDKKTLAQILIKRAFTPSGTIGWQTVNQVAQSAVWAVWTNKVLREDKSVFFKDEAQYQQYKQLCGELSGEDIAKVERDYTFIFVRQDISPEQQAVQAAHATYVAGAKFKPENAEEVHFVLIGVPNLQELTQVRFKLKKYGVEDVIFREPDLENQATAVATQVMKETQKRFLKKYKKLQLQ
jgi:hypothetical protein